MKPPSWPCCIVLPPQEKDDIDAKLKEFADTMKAAKSDGEQIKAIDALAATRALKARTKLVQVVGGPYPEASASPRPDAIGKIGDVRAGAGLMAFVGSLGPVLKSEVPSRVADQKVGEAAVRAVGTLRDKSATKQLSGMTISANVPLMGEVVRGAGQDPRPAVHGRAAEAALRRQRPRGRRRPEHPQAARARHARGPSPHHRREAHDARRVEQVVPAASAARSSCPPRSRSAACPRRSARSPSTAARARVAALRKFDLVLLNPDNYTKDELSNLFRPVALTGEPKAAMDKGFAGFVCEPEQAADLRKKFPAALIVAAAPRRRPRANAILVEDLDLKKPDEKALERAQGRVVAERRGHARGSSSRTRRTTSRPPRRWPRSTPTCSCTCPRTRTTAPSSP
jgi:hypothetical protein